MKVNIIKDNLTEEEAFRLEEETIKHYVYDLNYGIDIIGFNNRKDEDGHLTNHTFGGEGSSGFVHTEEWCKEHSVAMRGENNPMYGKNALDYMSEEDKIALRERKSKNNSGKNNPMYGISPRERMNDETYNLWYQKRIYNSTGERNPNYGNDALHKKLLEHPELKIQYYARPGGQNGRAVPIRMSDVINSIIKEFDCTSDCAKWIKAHNKNIKSNTTTMITSIKNATLNNSLYRNQYKFEYI